MFRAQCYDTADNLLVTPIDSLILVTCTSCTVVKLPIFNSEKMSSDEGFPEDRQQTGNGKGKSRNSQFQTALLKLTNRLDDCTLTKTSQKNISFSIPNKPEKVPDETITTVEKCTSSESIEKSDHNVSAVDSKATQDLEKMPCDLEQNLPEAVERLEKISFEIDGISNLVKTFQGTKESKQFRHLESSLIKCQVELDDINIMVCCLETRTLVRRDGTLFINPTSAEDSGRYTCEVTNGIGHPDSASAYLSVEYPARVTYSPTIQYLPLGLSGVIRCYVQASPPFQFITWTKDSRPFDPNSTPGVVTLTNGSLLFQRVSNENQGIYRCTPYNIHGTAGTSNKMEVLVREPPMFQVKPKDTYQGQVNSEVKMPCDGVGQPRPTISWRRAEGEKLPKDRSVIRGGNLTIRGLKKEDHGRYECVLENEIATLVTSTLLLVESTTPHAPTNVSVNTSAFASTLTWLPAYDGGYEQSYVVWYRLADQGDSDWRTIRVLPDGATTITLYNLQPDTDYDFQVLSRNILGDGMFSVIIKSKTKPWDYTGTGIYPTDNTGSTYLPTIVRPTGPKPWPPRNVTVRKEADGVLINWLPPLNQTVPVAFYFVEYRSSDKPWQRFEAVNQGTHYLAKNLQAGSYSFRVFSFSITSVGAESSEVRFEVQGINHEQNKSKAITAGVVGGILFFIAAIVLSVCAVKICNKRKRRKAEKAYMMVTCPVTDARNGGHSHGGSPVPLKKRKKGDWLLDYLPS